MLGFLVACCAGLFVATGCRRSANEPTGEPRPDPAQAEPAPPERKPPTAAAPRPKPRGRPAPTAECGHAVAFAGWRPDGGGARDVLYVCDPADNEIEAIGHAWAGKPRELPVRFGRQRPTIVLQPAAVFTITGAVVVTPRTAARDRASMDETRAAALPDLSQDFSPRWRGLCAPTSAADVLFSMHDRDADVLADFVRGPGDEADAGVARLVAGGFERIVPGSLAGRMGVGDDGNGATNDGIRAGLAAWLDDVDPEAWDVRLDWFADAPEERGRDEQREFLGRLAAAVEDGGGAVLCLWPGNEFADARVDATDEGDAEQASASGGDGAEGGAESGAEGGAADGDASGESGGPPAGAQADAKPGRPGGRDARRGARAGGGPPPLPDAEFPDLPPAAGRPGGLPGREAADPAAAMAQAERKLDRARRCQQRGDHADAFELAAEAVALLHEAARRDPAARERLAEAQGICRECDRRLPDRGVDPDNPTTFQ